MRTLLWSDHHSHSWKPYAQVSPEGLSTRLVDGLLVLEQLASLAERCDVSLFAGDLFHVRSVLNVPVFNLTYDAVAKIKLKCQLGMLPGNHDQVTRKGEMHSLQTFGVFCEVMDKPGWYPFTATISGTNSQFTQTMQVAAVPYHADAEVLKDQIKTLVRTKVGTPADIRVLLGHFGVDGGVVGSNFVLKDKNLLKVDDLYPDEFDHVFLGHYHQHQELAPNVHYIGATMHHNWGDAQSGQPVALVWDTERGALDRVPLEAPRFIRWNPGDPPIEQGRHIIEINAPYDQQVEESLLNSGALSVEFKASAQTKHAPAANVSLGMDHADLVKRYVDSNAFGDLDDQYLVELGQQLLSKAEE